MEPPFDHVLVPLDGSPEADRALDPAIVLAHRTGVAVTLLTQEVAGSDEGRGDHVAALAARHGGEATVDTVVVDRESAVLAITEACRPGTLVCMASHGRGRSQSVLGSVAEAVLRTVGRPVLMVGPRAQVDRSLVNGRVVACLDGSVMAALALDPARHWSDLLALPLWLVTVAARGAPLDRAERYDVLESGELAGVADRLGGVAGWEVLHDDEPASALARLAAEDVALLVMTTHGRTGWEKLLVGSVVSATIHEAPVPVLVIPSVSPEAPVT